MNFEHKVEIDEELTSLIEVGPIKDGSVLMEFHEELVALKHEMADELNLLITALAQGDLLGLRVNTNTEEFKKYISKPKNAQGECAILSENYECIDEKEYRYLPIFAVIKEEHCARIWVHPVCGGQKCQFGTQLTSLVKWWSGTAMFELNLRWNMRQRKHMETQTDPAICYGTEEDEN